MRRSSFALAALLMIGGPAFAQDPPAQDPPPPTFEDLKNSLGDLQDKRAREDSEKRDAIVQKNQEETLKIYQDTLGKKNGELTNVSKRLDSNKALHAKYTRLLEGARSELAMMRSQFINRTAALKKSLEEGKISKEAYEKLLEEDTKRFRNRETELREDMAFYQEEIAGADGKMKDLSVKKELMEFDPFQGEGTGEEGSTPKRPKPGIAEKLQRTIAEVSGYRTRSVMDTVR